jgi:outer membrane lipoprotein-sorting protein
MLVSQKVLFYDHESDQAIAAADETLRYVFPDVFRSDSASSNAKKIHLLSKGRSITIIDETISGDNESPFDLYKDILLYRSRSFLERRLSSLGVDISVTCFGRFQDRIAFVVGLERPNDRLPQIWIDKETFRPMRWLLVNNRPDGSGGDLDIRYSDWRRVRQIWYPMHVDIYMGDRLVREISVESLKVNPSFSDQMFDIETLKRTHSQRVSKSQDDSVSKAFEDIEKTIDDFRKKIE